MDEGWVIEQTKLIQLSDTVWRFYISMYKKSYMYLSLLAMLYIKGLPLHGCVY